MKTLFELKKILINDCYQISLLFAKYILPNPANASALAQHFISKSVQIRKANDSRKISAN
jgi:hypothetical protein